LAEIKKIDVERSKKFGGKKIWREKNLVGKKFGGKKLQILFFVTCQRN
jgi:hypothetical protein